jgi:hypothetical protein
MLNERTLLQSVMSDALVSFIASNENIYEGVSNPLDIQDGSYLFEVNSSSKAFNELLNEDYRERIASLPTVSTDMYRTQLGERIIKIDEDMHMRAALKLMKETIEVVGESFAGVLFQLQHGGIVNPLHPLVALHLIDNMPQLHVIKMYFYTYKDLNAIKNFYSTSAVFTEDELKGQILSIIRMAQSKVLHRSINVIKNDVNYNSKNIVQHYKVSKEPGEVDDKEYYVVAHQLLTKGTFVPYYGTSIISMNGSTSGFHISPFKSCNINRHEYYDSASVCTGSKSNKTIKGLRTLHHANLGSPYEKGCMSTASYPYAKACIDISLTIYDQALKDQNDNTDINQTDS